jgi:acetyl esterase/lipase
MISGNISISVPGYAEPAVLVPYVPSVSPEVDALRRRPAVIICPGGGYRFLSFREAEPVALRLNALGINAFVLYYSVAPAEYPVPQLQLAESVRAVGLHAADWATDPDKIFVMGFSAGGHLACSLGTLWNDRIFAPLTAQPGQIRPRGMILCYPVITSGEFAHRDSFAALLGNRHEELRDTVSLEKRVTAQTVPAFIWHTFEDALVPVENSLLLASALRANRVPFELHIYPFGQHGLSLSSSQVYGPGNGAAIRPECEGWIDMAARWMHAFL